MSIIANPPVREFHRDGYTITTDPARIDRQAVHAYLTTSYWSPGIPFEVVSRALDHSLCFGIQDGSGLVGFARVVTDQATFAYLADVFVLEAHRGRGLARWLVGVILDDPRLQGLRRFLLATRDAHALYRPFGFAEPNSPASFLEIRHANPYPPTP